MSSWSFLQEYIAHLDRHKHKSFRLNPGKSMSEIAVLEAAAGVNLPQELKAFYRFSYGARLGEYQLLTVPQIAHLLTEIRSTYEVEQISWLVPFANLVGVGDFVSFDVRRSTADGLLILDSFHEFSPDEWKGICYGLETWLRGMVNSGFEPFWLK